MNARRILPLLLAATALAAPALAADPESGTLSKSSPQVKWSGSTTNGGATTIPAVANGGAEACVSPSCDTFALKIADAGGNLKIKADAPDTGGFLMVQLVKPDGSKIYAGGAEAETSTTVALKNAPAGDYKVEIAANSLNEVQHTAVADLAFVSAAPPEDPSATPTPTPTATAPPSGSGGPTPPPAQQPAATLTAKAGKLSARKVNKRKRFAVSVSTTKTVSNVVVRLMKGSKTLANGSLASLTGTKSITVKFKRKLKAGSYVIAVAAKDGGQPVGTRIPVKIKK